MNNAEGMCDSCFFEQIFGPDLEDHIECSREGGDVRSGLAMN